MEGNCVCVCAAVGDDVDGGIPIILSCFVYTTVVAAALYFHLQLHKL